MYSCDCLRLTHTCVCNCTYMFQYWPKKASAAGSRLKAKPSEVRPHFNPLMVPNLLPSVGAVSRSNGTKRSCARLARSQPSHPRRAGAPRRPGRLVPVAVRAPQHPARRTCFVHLFCGLLPYPPHPGESLPPRPRWLWLLPAWRCRRLLFPAQRPKLWHTIGTDLQSNAILFAA